jgi:transposase InsO family protein
MHVFASVAEARVEAERYRHEYHEERPHSRLGYRTPAAFKADWLADQSTAAPPSHTARS